MTRHEWVLTGTVAPSAVRGQRGIYTCRNCRLVVESPQLPEHKRGEVWGGVLLTRETERGGRPQCRGK